MYEQSEITQDYFEITQEVIDEIKKSSGLSASNLGMDKEEFNKFIGSCLDSSISLILRDSFIKRYKPFPKGLEYITKQLCLNMLYREDVLQMSATFDTEKQSVRNWTPDIFSEDIKQLLAKYSKVTIGISSKLREDSDERTR
jgi:hypothetical protein